MNIILLLLLLLSLLLLLLPSTFMLLLLLLSLSLSFFFFLLLSLERSQSRHTADLRTTILDFRGFDSSRVLNLRGGILRSIGDFPESLSQRILAGIILVGRLGVRQSGQMEFCSLSGRGGRRRVLVSLRQAVGLAMSGLR